ncbi:unnamed protein product [Polarella glacialis]|uniref:subtilisin n=1 Tax=Polarella glacialis TaxID=89957 RepID=A0A813LUW7_POLGL|nr:unnamed protein product [Polarella glacialis]
MSGTSMACPYVSGVAALLWLYRPELSVAQVRDLLAASVTPLASLRDKIRTGGQVNAWRALHSAEALLNPRPPRQHPKGLAFKDEDPEVGSLSGTVTITAADDESDIEYYRVWFVGSDGSPLQALGKVNATGHSAPVVLPLSSTRLPALAVAMVAVAGNASGEQDFVSSATQDPLQPLATAALVDYVVPKSGPQGVYWFGDEDPRAGQLAGTLWAARATNEHSVSHYNVYWRNVSSRSEAGGQQQGSGGRGPLVGRLNATGYKAPVCSGSSCDLVSVSSSPKGGLRYERSNYTTDEFAVIAFSGPALFILTKLDSEASKDSISVGGQQFSGKPALPLQIMLPAGPSSIVWRSDASISGTGGWSFELVPSNATAQLELLLGTVPLADGLEVAAAYGDTELEAQGETSFLEIPDFDATSQPPSTAFTPSALRFVVDELGEPGTIAGMLRLLPSAAGATCAEGLAAVEFYQLDFADAAGLVVAPLLSKQGLLACSNNSSRWLELKLPPTKLPPQAVQLVARASNRFGIGLGRATFALEDAVRFAPGKAAFSGDEDPARGNIAGELLVWSSSGVQGTLKAYWSDGRSKFEELGELSANGSPGVLSLKIRTPQLGRGILIERFVKVKDWWDAQEHPLHWKLLTSSLARVSSLELDAAGKSQGSAGTEMPVLWSASPQEAAAIQATTKSADGSVFGSMSIKVACDEADFASLAKPASRAALAEVLATSLSSSASATSVLPLRLWIAQAATDHSISTNATTSRAATLTLEFAAVPGCGSESKQLALDHIEGRIILLGLEGLGKTMAARGSRRVGRGTSLIGLVFASNLNFPLVLSLALLHLIFLHFNSRGRVFLHSCLLASNLNFYVFVQQCTEIDALTTKVEGPANTVFCVSIADPRTPDNALIAVSNQFLAMTGYGQTEVLGKSSRFLSDGCAMDPEDQSRLRLACETGAPFTGVLTNRRKTGELFVKLLDMRGLTVARNPVTGQELWFLVGIQVDVTDSIEQPDDDVTEAKISTSCLDHMQQAASSIRAKLADQLCALSLSAASRSSSFEGVTKEEGSPRSDGVSSTASSRKSSDPEAWCLLPAPIWRKVTNDTLPSWIACSSPHQSTILQRGGRLESIGLKQRPLELRQAAKELLEQAPGSAPKQQPPEAAEAAWCCPAEAEKRETVTSLSGFTMLGGVSLVSLALMCAAAARTYSKPAAASTAA